MKFKLRLAKPSYNQASLLVFLIVLVWIPLKFVTNSAASGYSSHLRRYPYLTDVVNSYATVNWGTDQFSSSGAVRWGKAGTESCTAHYVPASRVVVNVNGVAEYQWKAMLNLSPGAQYCYRVYLVSSPANEVNLLGTNTTPTFWTQIPSGSNQPYSFVVFGDWGQVDTDGTNPAQARIMSLIAASGARFAVTAGDNGYPSGSQANYGDLIQTGSNISAIFGPSFWKVPGATMPIFPASGNHGISNSDPNHPMILNFPQDRAVASSGGRYVKETYCCLDGTTSANYPSAWYAFDAGLARIYVLDASWSDSNIGTATAYKVDYDYHWATSTLQYQWLQADLAAHPSSLKFAIFHYPFYLDDPNLLPDTYLQGSSKLEGLLHQYGVDIAFTGHSHLYERNLASAVGLPNYVTGGGGADLTNTLGTCTVLDAYAIKFTTNGGKACGSAPVPTSADQVHHFLLVTINGTHVTVSPTDSLGQTFDVINYDFSSGSEINPPSVPTDLIATPVNGTQINLSWTASSDDTGVRGYDVYQNGVLISTTDATTLTYSDTNLIPSVNYVYTVDAFDASGNHSVQSGSASATTLNTASYTFAPVADSYVAGDATSTNYGTSAVLKADASPDYHSYLRFNVNDIHGTVKQATLLLYTTSTSTIGYQVGSVTNNTWDEAKLTYTNSPALGAVESSSGSFSSNTWVSVDVTSLITGNGVYDLGLSTTSTSSISFNSRDAAANTPQLVIQTLIDAAPIPTSTNTPIVTSTSTPTETATPTSTATTIAAGPCTLTGNTGLAGVTLSYVDGTPKTVLSDASGNYIITVPRAWGGTITPSLIGYLFAPAVRNYSSLPGNMAGQNFNLYNVPPADFDGDHKTDVAVFRPGNGTWYISGQAAMVWGQAGDIPVPADYNGDGKADIAVFRPGNGTWYISGQAAMVWGQAGDIPVPADYNGDSKADIAVFRPSNSTWYIVGQDAVVYGQDGDIPVVADYNGDGKADIAVFRPSNSTWYLKGIGLQVYGTVGDIPVVADYNGDGKADIAVFRPTNSTWYIYGVGPRVYGTVGDIPAIGDYDGDGKADVTVFRPSNSTWYKYGVGPSVFGTLGDIPV